MSSQQYMCQCQKENQLKMNAVISKRYTGWGVLKISHFPLKYNRIGVPYGHDFFTGANN